MVATRSDVDVVVVGTGPNGLAAAVELASRGRSVLCFEAAATVGGGTRSAELTNPGFVHDVCAAVHPLLLASPFFQRIGLDRLGIEVLHPEVALAHPMPGGTSVQLLRSIEDTAARLSDDGDAYRRLMEPLLARAEALVSSVLSPGRIPSHPLVLARFAIHGIRSAEAFLRSRFRTEPARALLAGVAAHSMLPLDRSPTAGVGILLALLAHAVGWPLVRGGSQRIADGLANHLRSLGGEIVTDTLVSSMDELPPARAYLFDVTPRQLLGIAKTELPTRYRSALGRYRYGPGVFKVDWALSEPVPWIDESCRKAGTVHLGGTIDEIATSTREVWRGLHSEQPFVIAAQPTVVDPNRAPSGHHILWAYCRAPAGSRHDMTAAIEEQIERFAPGFRETIVARSTMDSRAMESHNANYVGGDINGGLQDLKQHFARPVARWSPYSTPARKIYLCSSATPPGGGVHGMCGYFAARAAVRRAF